MPAPDPADLGPLAALVGSWEGDAGVDVSLDRPFGALRDLVLQHAGAISGCILILIEWERERIELVRQLRALGVPVMTLLVTEPQVARAMEAARKHGESAPDHVLELGKVREGLAKLG